MGTYLHDPHVMQCPECGSFEPFEIHVDAIAKVYDDGTEGFQNIDWDSNSNCYCSCGFWGKVKDFHTQEVANAEPRT